MNSTRRKEAENQGLPARNHQHSKSNASKKGQPFLKTFRKRSQLNEYSNSLNSTANLSKGIINNIIEFTEYIRDENSPKKQQHKKIVSPPSKTVSPLSHLSPPRTTSKSKSMKRISLHSSPSYPQCLLSPLEKTS